MVIGFLGKGGSGKSSIATLVNNHLISEGNKVLAVDADHNMDLAYNIVGAESESMIQFGASYDELQELSGYTGEAYDSYVIKQKEPVYSFSKPDSYSEKYASKLGDNQYLMIAGEHTENILHGQRCSHTLSTPMKVYLPLLDLNEDEYVVVDYLAGSDGVATGVVTGMDFVVVVVEDTPHSVKAAKQITDLLEFFRVPYGHVINKAHGEYRFITDHVKDNLVFTMPFTDVYSEEFKHDMSPLLELVKSNLSEESKLERTKYKFKNNLNYGER